MAANSVKEAFQVTGWSHRIGGWVERHKGLVLKLADIEAQALESHIAANPVREPVYVCGLARAGTTIMLETLAGHDDVGTHRYADYPLIHLPYWWTKIAGHMLNTGAAAAERAHGDGMLVTPESPEAMEEAIWMSFFDNLHETGHNHVLDAETDNPEFERQYRAHIAKLLLAREKPRYVSKANYNVSRLAYIQKIFPDARFVVPVREPVSHVASLMRQHRRFTEGLADNAKGREHLRRIGHFEFGPDRSAISTGVDDGVEQLWAGGEEVRGWARYWARLYGFVADQFAATTNFGGAAMLLRFEDLCAAPDKALGTVIDHVRLEADREQIAEAAARISAPDYYDCGFSDTDLAIIAEETGTVAKRLGY